MKSYPLGHALNNEEIRALGHDKPAGRKVRPMAVDSGEVRPPKKGEWYFAGPVIRAFRAAKDLTAPAAIARLVPQL